MRRTHVVVTLIVGLALFLSTGCVSNMYPGGPSPAGLLYTQIIDPSQSLTVATDPTSKGMRKGVSSSMGILGLVAWGDAGIDAAMANGGITRVHHVDHAIQLSLVGLYMRKKTIVYGQ